MKSHTVTAGTSRSLSGSAAPRRRPLGLALALLLGVTATAHAEPHAPAMGADAWNAATRDARFRTVKLMTAAQRSALARDHGLESLLTDPRPDATVFVTNCANSGAGSLRDGIAGAADGSVIDMTGLTCSSITLGSGEIAIPQHSLTLRGPGKDVLTVAPKYGRIFKHTGNGQLVISGMHLRSGGVDGGDGAAGGCVYSLGDLAIGNPLLVDQPETGTLIEGCHVTSTNRAYGGGVSVAGAISMTNSTISGSEAKSTGSSTSFGGGLFARGGLSMKYSEIRNNKATGANGEGGGANVREATGNVYLYSSTFAGNTATGYGGGITSYQLAPGEATIGEVTISGNIANHSAGAALFIGGGSFITLHNSTITANVSTGYEAGSGLRLYTATALRSTIVSGNFKGTSVPDDINAGSNSVFGSSNLIGVHTGSIPDDTRISSNPQLSPLGGHGGPTRTHVPLSGSVVIEAGDNNYSDDNDQRGPGHPRTIGLFPDIGATEFDPDVIFAAGFE